MGELRVALKKSPALVGIVRGLRRTARSARRRIKTPLLARRLTRSKRIREYLRSTDVRKLQLGSGPTSLPGWLSSDIAPASAEVVFLDVTKPFPFDSALFDYVFAEHLIEHVSWLDGGKMLRECFRVLKPGGILRAATPDLTVLLSLYAPPETPGKKQYIQGITETFLRGVDVAKAQFVINNAFRYWGHQFLYDGEILELALRRAGFDGIERCAYGESGHSQLRGIESHGINPRMAALATFETMIYEAKRPA